MVMHNGDTRQTMVGESGLSQRDLAVISKEAVAS
jgi:hypothetical protein